MVLTGGRRLGPYEVLSPLGAGGMGEVYRARDTRLGREVAVKVLPAEVHSDEDRLKRFDREARSASALNHPNILTVHDVGVHEGVPYVVTELLEGRTLREEIAGGALSPRKAGDLAIQVAQGLASAHESGIVHRDLKPENIFVTKDGRAKILDFGLARAMPARGAAEETDAPTATGITEAGVVLGTAGYMSPEQVCGQPADERSDLFSFGAVLYEMLTGRRAFRGRSAPETMSAVLREEPPPVLEVNPGVPPAFERVVRRCLEKKPELRFQSARDLAFALSEATTGSGVPSVPAARLRPGFRKTFWIAVTIAAAAIAAAFLLVSGRPPRTAAAKAGGPIQSLAVLPLENLSKDPSQEYFSDGMTEELIANLARLGGVRVISRTSVMGYKGARKAMPEIARELGVDALIEGSVMRSGDQVRITAQLIHGPTDRHLWAESYQRQLRDVLAMQTEVAGAIAKEIEAKLTPPGESTLPKSRPVDPEAHELYLKGRFEQAKLSEASLHAAIEDFQKAIGRDPGFAPAYAGLADSYAFLRSTYAAPKDVMPQSVEAARKALELDENLAEAHVSMGLAKFFYEFDWAGAEKHLRRAIELNPNLAEAHDAYANFLAGMNRTGEAVAEIEKARRLDPLSLLVLADSAWVFYCAGRYDRVIEECGKAIALDPNFWVAHTFLGLGYEKTGRFAEAVEELQKARKLDDNPTIYEMLGGVYAAWGKKDEAKRVVRELTERSTKRYVCPYEIATIHAGLGDRDAAFEWLAKAADARADCMPWVQPDPKIDILRSDPRYAALLDRIGLAPAKGAVTGMGR